MSKGEQVLAESRQLSFFQGEEEQSDSPTAERLTSTFVDNMRLPVHRWFRYSAGFPAEWVKSVIANVGNTPTPRVFDPFAGSGTTLIAAEDVGVPAKGVESHPFVCRVAKAKQARRNDPRVYQSHTKMVQADALKTEPQIQHYPELIRRCYRDDVLADLDRLRTAYENCEDGSPASELCWLTLVSILRKVSHVGTAQWQYVLPNKSKKNTELPFDAFERQVRLIHRDMLKSSNYAGPASVLVPGDARTCEGIESDYATLIITSPPYPNNFDYADTTRLEMTFMREIDGWGDLQKSVRRHLIRSCSQHVPQKDVNLDKVLTSSELLPIRAAITAVCQELGKVRESKGGKKTYHLMIACYFYDMAQVWLALRRVCASPSRVCFVIGNSAPYGVYVPVYEWMGKLAQAAGFGATSFEKTRDRNVKWKNRKHRVPLSEGRLWVEG